MAPCDSRQTYGVFHLSEPGGLELIQACELRGFHEHPGGRTIYENASHVRFVDGGVSEIVDLR
jgi:STAM-binding protein